MPDNTCMKLGNNKKKKGNKICERKMKKRDKDL